MTRRQSATELNVHVAAQIRMVEVAAAEIFDLGPAWQLPAALSALYRLRPDLGRESDDQQHAIHMLNWPRNDLYFARVCRLLKMHGIGAQGGE